APHLSIRHARRAGFRAYEQEYEEHAMTTYISGHMGAAMKKTVTRPRRWKLFAVLTRPRAGDWFRRVSVECPSDRGARFATRGRCRMIRRKHVVCLLPAATCAVSGVLSAFFLAHSFLRQARASALSWRMLPDRRTLRCSRSWDPVSDFRVR